jgi:cytochrome c biogenesis protein
MIGVVMSYFSHSQIWALEQDRSFYFGAKTNRAQVSFEREMLGVIDALNERSVAVDLPESRESLVNL